MRPFLRTLEKMNQSVVVVGALAATCALSGIVMMFKYQAVPVPTMTKEWIEANKEYMKFQNMNPIFGECTLLYFRNVFFHFTCFNFSHLQESAARSEEHIQPIKLICYLLRMCPMLFTEIFGLLL